MRSHSGLVARVPGSTIRKDGTDSLRNAIGACYGGQLHRAPLSGGERARRRKIDGSLNLTSDDVIAVIGDRNGEHAVPIMRAIAAQAGVDDRLIVKAAAICLPSSPSSIADAELEFASASARLIGAVDEIRTHRCRSSIEARRLMEFEQAVEARAALIARAIEFEGVDFA